MEELNLSKLRFLVVDDNTFMRNLIRTILSAFGCRIVLEAGDGAEALKMLEGGANPDIIIADWEMPELNGLELVQRIRHDEKSSNKFVPVIMVSAYSELKSVCEARDSGVNEFLVKPISAKGLYSRISAIAMGSRSFVHSGEFFGPDRRRRAKENIGQEDRRGDKDDQEM